jgi:hypothetical protein
MVTNAQQLCGYCISQQDETSPVCHMAQISWRTLRLNVSVPSPCLMYIFLVTTITTGKLPLSDKQQATIVFHQSNLL